MLNCIRHYRTELCRDTTRGKTAACGADSWQRSGYSTDLDAGLYGGLCVHRRTFSLCHMLLLERSASLEAAWTQPTGRHRHEKQTAVPSARSMRMAAETEAEAEAEADAYLDCWCRLLNVVDQDHELEMIQYGRLFR